MQRAAALALVGYAALAAACGRKQPDQTGETTTAAPVASAPASAHAPDELAPGELLEGSKKALGVTLPRDLQVEGSFVDLVYASGQVGVHPLVQYFRAHLTGGSLREGTEAATFEGVHAPGAPERELRVRIALLAGGSRVEIRDTTPPHLPALSDESARWRQVGLTPNGRLADPTHLD
jgi:hypothetical protein